MKFHWSEIPGEVLAVLRDGAVIPAHPLALDASRRLDRRRQCGLSRYYVDAGAGGLAVGVHTTQFAIREAGLYEPVLRIAAEAVRCWTKKPLAMIAGLCGGTKQACEEAAVARALGYHAGLLSLAGMKGASQEELIEHCATVAREMPLVGFYLQPAVGGIALGRRFWARFATIENVIAIKVAPFDRYGTLDVIRGVVTAGAEDRIVLYTGNDDHIVLDLVTPFMVERAGQRVVYDFAADCWDTGRSGFAARSRSSRDARCNPRRRTSTATSSRSTAESPIATAHFSTPPIISRDASLGATRSCAARACSKEFGVSTQTKA